MSEEYIYKPPASLPPGSTVIAYLRDSGGPNQEESIGQQLRIVQDYCKEHGLHLDRVYSDTASGRKTKNRDEFIEMFDSVMTVSQDMRPRGLLLWAYSRFSRDIVDFNYYLYGLLKRGLVVHSLTEEIPEGLAGQILLSVKAYINADFSLQLGKNIKRGIADLVGGGYNNGGQAPRGYRIERIKHASRRNGQDRIGIKWVPDPEVAPLVRLAWQLRAQGKGYGEITRATGGRIYSKKNSWSSHFGNKSYLGIGKAGELEVHDHHEPLVTHELWDAVQNLRAATPRRGGNGGLNHPRRVSHPSLLSGFSFCAHCGSAMVLHTARQYRSYRCGTRDRGRIYRDCTDARGVNARKADTAILDAVLLRILSPAFVGDLLNDIQGQLTDTRQLDREIKTAQSELGKISRKIASLIGLAEQGTGDVPELAKRLRELKVEEAAEIAHLKQLKAERTVEAPKVTSETLTLIFDLWCRRIQDAIQSGDVLEAKRLITQFVKKIELNHKTAVIHYVFPFEEPIPILSLQNESLCAH